MKKKLISFFLAAATVTSVGIFSNNLIAKADNVQSVHQKQADGWINNEGQWQYYQNGDDVEGWQTINGHWYYFNDDGIMQTGWQSINGNWYYLNPNGDMVTGWKELGSIWYYLNEDGSMATGWQLINGHWYYLNGSGAMQVGWINLGNTWYFLNDSGQMQTGWLQQGGSWCYLYDSGAMATGQVNVDGKLQNFNSNGVWTGQVADINTPMWVAGNGSRIYHDSPECSNMRNPIRITLGDAKNRHLNPCSKCDPSR